MGFFRDWAAHWRGMASNSQRAAVRFVAAPLSHVRAAITSPFSFAFWFFIVMLYFNRSEEANGSTSAPAEEPQLRRERTSCAALACSESDS